jgi:hypothetical protein
MSGSSKLPLLAAVAFLLAGTVLACGSSSTVGGSGHGGAGASGGAGSQTFYGSAQLAAGFVPGQPVRQTYVLSDVTATSFTLDQVETVGTIIARAHETAAVSGMTVTFTQTCPPADAGIDWGGSDELTASSTSITLIRSVTGVSGLTEVRVYDRAP